MPKESKKDKKKLKKNSKKDKNTQLDKVPEEGSGNENGTVKSDEPVKNETEKTQVHFRLCVYCLYSLRELCPGLGYCVKVCSHHFSEAENLAHSL